MKKVFEIKGNLYETIMKCQNFRLRRAINTEITIAVWYLRSFNPPEGRNFFGGVFSKNFENQKKNTGADCRCVREPRVKVHPPEEFHRARPHVQYVPDRVES